MQAALATVAPALGLHLAGIGPGPIPEVAPPTSALLDAGRARAFAEGIPPGRTAAELLGGDAATALGVAGMTTVTETAAKPAAGSNPAAGYVHISMESLEKAYAAFQREDRGERKAWDLVVPEAPHGGGIIVVAGIEPTLADIRSRRFSREVIETLRKTGKFSEDFLEYLFEFQFNGGIDAVQEGRVISPNIPVLRLHATETELALLQDLIKNRMGVSMTVATKAARIAMAANGEFIDEKLLAEIKRKYRLSDSDVKRVRTVLDFGFRRAQGYAADLATRAAIIGGAAKTSNVRAALKHYVQMSGTMAHLFIMLYPPEEELQAFRDYVKAWPGWCTLLVDTYDTIRGVKNAITVAKEMEARGERLVGIRLDSGDLKKLSRKARAMLDAAGLRTVKIFASNDLDEHTIHDLIANGAPIDGFGVGTQMITGGRQASLPMEFILSNKDRIWRCHQGQGRVHSYIRTPENRAAYAGYSQEIWELLIPFWRDGKRVFGVEKPWKAHRRTQHELEYMRPGQKKLENADPIPTFRQDNPLTIDPETDASITVDVQTAFTKGGGLEVKDGDAVVPVVKRILDVLPSGKDQAVATLDSHRWGSVSLYSSFVGCDPLTLLTYDMVKDWTEDDHRIAPHALFTLDQLKAYLKKVGAQMLWPDHAVVGSGEERLHPGLRESDFVHIQVKGMDADRDSYSGFFDNAGNPTGLADRLRAMGKKRLIIKGLAGDYCVGFTAIGGAQEGFEVIVVEDGQRNVGFPADQLEKIYAEYKRLGIKVVQSSEIVEANRQAGVVPASVLARPIPHPVAVDDDADVAFMEDAYHLTMGQAIFASGQKDVPVVFDYFFRSPPYEGVNTVMSGLHFFLQELRDFRFNDDLIAYLQERSEHDFTPGFLEYLRNFRFTGSIEALPDGSVAFPSEPVMTLIGGALEVQILETFVLNRRNFATLIGANTRNFRKRLGEEAPLIEAGMAEAQGNAHIEASFSAYVAGTDATTNLDAHHRFGIPLADAGTPGTRLRAELTTGGDKTALNGVFKLARAGDVDRIKVSNDPKKATFPGLKDIAIVRGPDGMVRRRLIVQKGQGVKHRSDETVEYPRIKVCEEGEALVASDVEAAQEARRRRQEDVRTHQGVTVSQPSRELLTAQRDLRRRAKGL